MSKFNITKKIHLGAVLGEGYEQSVLEFKPITFADAKQLDGMQSGQDFTPNVPAHATPAQAKKLRDDAKALENKAALVALDAAIEFIKGKFVSGVISGVAVAPDDFTNGNLPVDVINHCMRALVGGKTEDFTQG